jgi:hypothetical protein
MTSLPASSTFVPEQPGAMRKERVKSEPALRRKDDERNDMFAGVVDRNRGSG